MSKPVVEPLDMPTLADLCPTDAPSNRQFQILDNQYLIDSLALRPDLLTKLFTNLRDTLNATEFEENCKQRPKVMATLLLTWQRELARSTMKAVEEAQKLSNKH